MLSLLDLPSELREQIYIHTFAGNRWGATESTYPSYHWKTSSFARFRSRLRDSFRQPALSATCKLVRQEALPVFYGIHHAEFSSRIGGHFAEGGLQSIYAGRTLLEWQPWWEGKHGDDGE